MIKVNYNKNNGKVIGFNLDTPNYIEITEEERMQPLPDKYSYYAVVNKKFTILTREITKEEENMDKMLDIKNRLGEIKIWFLNNDWKINKIVIGEWGNDDIRWTSYIEERNKIRKEQDELNLKLKELEKNFAI